MDYDGCCMKRSEKDFKRRFTDKNSRGFLFWETASRDLNLNSALLQHVFIALSEFLFQLLYCLFIQSNSWLLEKFIVPLFDEYFAQHRARRENLLQHIEFFILDRQAIWWTSHQRDDEWMWKLFSQFYWWGCEIY